jgi:hypothetical protein
MQDCVIGCFSDYGWEDVRVWARSLAASGFAGRRVALVRNPKPDCVPALVGLGFDVVDVSRAPVAAMHHVERFSQVRRYLFSQRQQGVQFRWVVTTDVRDVCFQRDPIAFLARLDPPRLVLSQEGLRYRDAEWNAGNLMASFGDEALAILGDTPACNAGVLAGGHQMIEGLSHLIETLARAAFIEASDQASLNLLTSSLASGLFAHRAGSAEPWACQAGVMADPRRIARNRPNLLGPEPMFRDGIVRTANGEPYAIVHQYDRVPAWDAAITARFGS